MLLKKNNLIEELKSERKKFMKENDILEQIRLILNENEINRTEIDTALKSKSSTNQNNLVFDLLDSDKIFHLEQIKSICIDYRLRFLDSHLFKGKIPEEAISKITQLEKSHQTKLEGFKIMAPAKLFKLENYDDPLLFAPVGNGYYYLIHKWGNDINPFRKMLMMPFRSLETFIFFLTIMSILISSILPINLLGKTTEGVFRLVTFLFILKSLIGISIYYCFWQGKNFNEDIWRSTYYNN